METFPRHAISRGSGSCAVSVPPRVSPASSRMRLPINRTKKRTCLNGESGASTAPRQNDQPQLSTPAWLFCPKDRVPLGKPAKTPQRGMGRQGREDRQGSGIRMGRGHTEAGSGSRNCRGPAWSGRTRRFPSWIPPASADVDGRPRGERVAQATHLLGAVGAPASHG